MSKPIFGHHRVIVTSYCGPANTIERTRMRVQIETLTHEGEPVSLGFNDVVALSNALNRWIVEKGQGGS